jgi:integrase
MAKVRKRTWESGGTTKTAWIADYIDQAGRRHIKTCKTKREADAFLTTAKHEISQGTHTPASASITLAQAGAVWLEQAETDGLEASTVRQYRQHVDLHINPILGGVKLSELSASAVQDFRNRLIREGRSRVMAKKVISSLGAILAEATANGKVARNVVREQARHQRTRQSRIEKRHKKQLEVGVDIPTKDEIRAMLASAQGRWRPLVVTAIFTGLRASELRGLRWDDIDFDEATLTVRQRADRWNAIGSPKSGAGKRQVPLAPIVISTLREWKLACPRGEANLVFPNRQGNVETLPSIHYRGLGPLQVAAGVAIDPSPKYGMHALRHAAASLFIE